MPIRIHVTDQCKLSVDQYDAFDGHPSGHWNPGGLVDLSQIVNRLAFEELQAMRLMMLPEKQARVFAGDRMPVKARIIDIGDSALISP